MSSKERYYRVHDLETDLIVNHYTGRERAQMKKRGRHERASLILKELEQLFKDGRILAENALIRVSNLISDHLWVTAGRPTWFIHPDMMMFLEDMRVDAKIEDVFVPHDAMCFVFPYGTAVNGIPCRSVLSSFCRAEKTIELMRGFLEKHQVGIETKAFSALRSLYLRMDVGRQGRSEEYYSMDKMADGYIAMGLPASDTVKGGISKLKEADKNQDFGPKHDEFCPEFDEERLDPVTEYMSSMIIRALLYVQTCKEGLERTPQPRSKGKNGKKGKIPPWRSTVKPTRKLLESIKRLAHAQGNHNSPRPHMRGWVLRTLRHERYKRNPDGSCKTVLVEPTMIGTKDVDDLGAIRAGEELKPVE